MQVVNTPPTVEFYQDGAWKTVLNNGSVNFNDPSRLDVMHCRTCGNPCMVAHDLDMSACCGGAVYFPGYEK
jgi:hypothetical protein